MSAEPTAVGTERDLAADLALATVRLSRHLRTQRADDGISLTQLSALATLDQEGPMTPGSLAARERVQPPSMTRVVASLVELGLVERSAHPTDGRQVIVTISDEGLALLRRHAAQRQQWLRDRLGGRTDEEREVLTRAVAVLRALVDDDE